MPGPCSPKQSPAHFTVLSNLFYLDVKQPFKHSPMRGPCSPKHSSSRFTVLNNLFILMLNSLSRTLTSALEPCSPKHRPAHLTVSNNSFYLDVKQPFKSVQFYSRAVLSQAWPSSCHDVKHIIHLGVYAQVALPQHGPPHLTA